MRPRKILVHLLVPKVIEFDAENQPKAHVEKYVCSPEKPKAEMIPWDGWLGSVMTETVRDVAIGKMSLGKLAIGLIHICSKAQGMPVPTPLH